MLRAGKYDEQAEKLINEIHAQGLVLIVIGGNKGTGMSVKSDRVLLAALPQVLRHTADMIEAEVASDLEQTMRWP